LDAQYILIQSYELWNEMIKYFPEKGINIPIVRQKDETKISGYYSRINGDIIMLYKKRNSLYVKVKNSDISLSNEFLTVSFTRVRKNNEIVIRVDQDILFSLSYLSCIYDPVNIADQDFNNYKEEDQDFLLFLYNIIKDRERQKVLLETWV